MKTFIIFTIICLLIQGCTTYKKGVIYNIPNQLYGDTALIGKRYGLDAIFKLSKDSIYENRGKAHKIILPSNLTSQPIYWGSFYSRVSNNNTKNVFYILTDTVLKNAKLIVDKNYNFNFSDDSIVNCLDSQNFEIEIVENKNNFPTYKVQIHINSDSISKLIRTTLHKNKMGLHHPSKIYRMVQEVRYNYKKIILPDSLIITIQDYNCNGKFNDKDDKIFAYDPLVKKSSNKKIEFYYKKGIIIPSKNKSYELLSIDKYGTKIELLKCNIIVDTINRFENIELETLENTNVTYNDLVKKNKFTIVYFWGTWCKPCVQNTDFISSIYEKYKDKINFYSFNYGDKNKTINDYKELKKINFPIYKINDFNLKINQIEGFPTLLIIDKDRLIIQKVNDYSFLKSFLEKL